MLPWDVDVTAGMGSGCGGHKPASLMGRLLRSQTGSTRAVAGVEKKGQKSRVTAGLIFYQDHLEGCFALVLVFNLRPTESMNFKTQLI